MSTWRRPLITLGLAALYLGILLSGMALPWLPAIAIGSAALLAYNALMRPSQIWAPNAQTFALTLVFLCLLAVVIVLIGQALARLLPPPAPLVGPALSLVGIAASRLAWSAEKEGEFDAFLDKALHQIDGISRDIERSAESHDALAAGIHPLSLEREAELYTLRQQLALLPTSPKQRAERLRQLLAPFQTDWPNILPRLYDPSDPATVEAAAHLLLSPMILPAAFGHPTAAAALGDAFLRLGPAIAEASATRALALDLDIAQSWRLLPLSGDLMARAAAYHNPPALTRLAALIRRREEEDRALH